MTLDEKQKKLVCKALCEYRQSMMRINNSRLRRAAFDEIDELLALLEPKRVSPL